MTIGIVGLGLIGGSFAKSFKANTDHRILGLDTDIDVMTMAALSGAVDGALTAETLGGCDVVLAALPPAYLGLCGGKRFCLCGRAPHGWKRGRRVFQRFGGAVFGRHNDFDAGGGD